MQKLTTLIVCFFIMTTLQACTDIAMTGAQVVYNRRSLQSNFGDQYLTMLAHQAIYIKSDDFKNANIVIATYHGEMLLTGEAPESWQKKKAEELVNKLPHVKHVYNLISLGNPSSTLTRFSDTWVTAKIKAKLLASNEVDSSLIKVLTENGTVYLLGYLSPEDAQAAVNIAKNTDGVQSVVKIFSYLRLSKR